MPLRSTGCYTCRKRKIRCDETRPHCRKCATHGVSCPGYRDPDDDFRDQTSITAEKAEIKYRARAIEKGKRGGIGDVKIIAEYDMQPKAGAITPCKTSYTRRTSETQHHPSAIRDLLSPAVVRTQLYSTFMTIYLPQKTSRIDHFSFYELLASRRPSTTDSPGAAEGVETVLSSSLDALSLVTIGATSHNQTFLDQSVRAYCSALTRLRHTLTKPGALQNDDVLAATNVLSQCALYEEIAQRAEGWTAHTAGCQQLIAARGGPGSLQSPLATLMFSSLRHSALCAGLISRKAPLMAQPQWRRKARETLVNGALQEGLMGTGERSVEFYDAAIQVPGLLERYDDLVMGMGVGSTTVMDLEGFLVECRSIEGKMRDCFWGWGFEHAFLQEPWTYDLQQEEAGGGENSTFFTEEPIENFPTFCQVFPDKQTFPHAYAFPNFSIGYLASLYWMCVHFVRTTVQQTHKLRHDLDKTWYPDPGEEVNEQELLELIFHLCKTFPFFCEPISGSTGHIGIFLPMRTAAMYFTQRGHWKFARWVGMIRNCVFTKGLAPPNVGDPVTR
ncbi:hypothetical protein KC315_g254 [Hortaea werneckii]|nr:hypothetical protein KC315_g254 [Hortaea werneckii]KAI7362999.1 hypothetical protein KC354_g6837 [Hortaea werneckii]